MWFNIFVEILLRLFFFVSYGGFYGGYVFLLFTYRCG